jgi:hypothetical protein
VLFVRIGGGVKFASWVFRIAGLWGILVLAPQYFLFETINQQHPPPVTHPELYYGFLGVALAWQIAFIVIAADPVRFRPIMIAAVFEKASYVIAIVALYMQQRVSFAVLATAGPDLLLGGLFVASFLKTRAVPILRREVAPSQP